MRLRVIRNPRLEIGQKDKYSTPSEIRCISPIMAYDKYASSSDFLNATFFLLVPFQSDFPCGGGGKDTEGYRRISNVIKAKKSNIYYIRNVPWLFS